MAKQDEPNKVIYSMVGVGKVYPQKQEKLRVEAKTESERQKTLERELEWIHMAPRPRHAEGNARIQRWTRERDRRPPAP